MIRGVSPIFAVWWWLHPDYMAVSQVVLGTLGFVAAVIAIVLAWRIAKRQFEIMADQGRVIDRQVTLLEEHKDLLSRIEAVENDQGKILKRQGEIAEWQRLVMEEQHEFFREQRDNKPSLELWITGMEQISATATRLAFSIRNGGRAAATGFAWEIVLPYETSSFVAFRTESGNPAAVKVTIDFARQVRINFFKKEIWDDTLFVGDMVDVAWIVVEGSEFTPFQIQWRIYGSYGTVPAEGHNVINVAPRPEGLLNVQPVLTIPAVTPA